MILSVDPGTPGCGLALWELTGELHRAWFAKGLPREWCLRELGPYRTIRSAVVERPQVYVQWRQKGDPNDLVEIALLAGEVVGWLRNHLGRVEAAYPLPSEWKGQLKKEVTTPRVRAALSPEELSRVEMLRAVNTLGHNVWDAVGIGLVHLGRKQKGVI